MGIKQCSACKGTKTVLKMGMMGTENCSQCAGIGYINGEIVHANPDVVPPVISVKRRGRPARITNAEKQG